MRLFAIWCERARSNDKNGTEHDRNAPSVVSLEATRMMSSDDGESEQWINLVDLDAIPDPLDKADECRFFFELIEKESDARRFRWLVSAFFGAAYSFFEIAALSAYHKFSHPKTGDPMADEADLKLLRRYVRIVQNVNNPSFVKTSGLHPTIEELYKLRRANTHHSPLTVMATNTDLPEGFHFGYVAGEGVPALRFCRTVMELVEQVSHELRDNL